MITEYYTTIGMDVSDRKIQVCVMTKSGVNPKIVTETTIPTTKSQVFSTAADNQPAVDIHVLQGERPMANDNKTLGRFQLGDIPLAPRGVPQIEVKFDIDANGIVNVSAKDLGTGKAQSITITGGGSLSDAEIERMVREAEENAEADKKRKEEAELINEANQMIFSTNKALEDLKDNISEQEKSEAQAKVSELEQALASNDLELIKTKKDELEKVVQALATKVYQQAQQAQQQAQQQGQSNGSRPDDVVDAD